VADAPDADAGNEVDVFLSILVRNDFIAAARESDLRVERNSLEARRDTISSSKILCDREIRAR
jgi:hypothetical protein